jgi:hypothetical protein
MKPFIIKNKFGRVLSDIESWKTGFIEVKKEPRHWRPDYSAHSLGVFFTEGKEKDQCSNGQRWVEGLVEKITGHPFLFGEAEIKHASKVDTYRGGQRMQDLSIWGESDGASVFIGIEAKVLESFDKKVVELYNELFNESLEYNEYKQKNPRSMKDKRIENLVARFFPGKLPTDDTIGDFRYQLLHYIASSQQEGITLKESRKRLGERVTPDIVILPVIVFRTPHYYEDKKQAEDNKNDYLTCLGAIGFKKDDSLSYKGTDVFVLEASYQSVYSVYAEIDI